MVLVETLIDTSESVSTASSLDVGKTLAQMLRDEATEEDEPLQLIGEIADPNSLSDIHVLFQDVCLSWTVQENLQGLIETTERFRTYLNLSVQIAISYMYFVSIGTLRSFPRLSDYQYFNPSGVKQQDFGPHNIQLPYFSVGFGSKVPRKSTALIGGINSPALHLDEAMIRLGSLLHQIGCWSVTGDDGDVLKMKMTTKSRRNELIDKSGIRYTGTVDLCLNVKEEYSEPHTEAQRIYRNVIVPLQELVDEIKWDF